MTTRRRFLQLLGMAPIVPAVLKIPPAMAALPDPTVEQIVNYVDKEIVKPEGILVANKLYDITQMNLSNETVIDSVEVINSANVWEVYREDSWELEVECAHTRNMNIVIGEELSLSVEEDSFRIGFRQQGSFLMQKSVYVGFVREKNVEIMWASDYLPRLRLRLSLTEPVSVWQ